MGFASLRKVGLSTKIGSRSGQECPLSGVLEARTDWAAISDIAAVGTECGRGVWAELFRFLLRGYFALARGESAGC
jgi:hypothetical protein